MSAELFDWLLNIGGLLTAFSRDGYLALRASLLGGLLAAALTLTLMIYAVGLILGWSRFELPGLIKVLALIFIVVIGVTSYSLFGNLLIDGFFYIPQELAGALMGAAETAGGGMASSGVGVDRAENALRNLYAEVMEAVSLIAHSGSGIAGRFLVALLTVVVLAAGLGMLAVALFNLVLAQAGTAILLALTPLFFIFLLFQVTRDMFFKWWGQLWNYFFLTLFTYVVLAMFLGITQTAAQQLRRQVESGMDPDMSLVAPFLVVCAVAMFMLFVVHGIAAGVAGGVAMNTAAAARSATTGVLAWAAGAGALGGRVGGLMSGSKQAAGAAGVVGRAAAGARSGGSAGAVPNRSGTGRPRGDK